ncbi:MAG: hypothetical protein V2A73_18145 [Pseudomonadota bacterium]
MLGLPGSTWSVFQKSHQFRSGQLVKWKAGMKIKKLPAYGEPVVMVEALPQPVFDDEKDDGSPFFREPLDLPLGVTDSDGDYLVFYCDRRRFESYNQTVASLGATR